MTNRYEANTAFGWPNTFDPYDKGLAIEDVWPSLYIGAARVPELARKAGALPWAKAAVDQWKREADSVLAESPAFVPGRTSGRGYFDENFQHLRFDPFQSETVASPYAAKVRPHDEETLASWRLYSHERLRRLMSSLAFLHHLTGDERYSQWVWQGLRSAALELYAPENRPADGGRFSVVYGGLYEAQSALQLVQTLALVADAPGADAAVREALEANALTPIGEALSGWMKLMDAHNMTCWSMAALGALGTLLGRDDWRTEALQAERNGLGTLLERGFPRSETDNQPDGFWFETSTFYNFYACIPLIALYDLGREHGVVTPDMRERFESMFAGPLHLVDEHLRFVTIGDRLCAGYYSIAQMRHFYEYAAGQVDEGRYGPVLALLYEKSGAPRNSLSALAYGPDELPPACEAPRQSARLSAARLTVFRKPTERGQITLWFLVGEENHSGQGHHHHDKLSISLHAFGEVIASDPGLPHKHRFLSSTFLHNTLLLDERSQGTFECLEFAADLEADIPWAYGRSRGNRDGARGKFFEGLVKRGHDVEAGVYDDAVLERMVFFDAPFIAVSDRFDCPTDHRLGFVFHANGSLIVDADPAPAASTLDLPPLPDREPLDHFFERTRTEPLQRIVADWRVRADVWLRMVTVCEEPFEAIWGRTTGNPRPATRGTVFLRTPGRAVRYATVFELHAGTPQLETVTFEPNGLCAHMRKDADRRYTSQKIG